MKHPVPATHTNHPYSLRISPANPCFSSTTLPSNPMMPLFPLEPLEVLDGSISHTPPPLPLTPNTSTAFESVGDSDRLVLSKTAQPSSQTLTAIEQSQNGCKSARRRPRGRRGIGGRGRRGRAQRETQDHTDGWQIQTVQEQPIKREHDFTADVLSERARRFTRAALERMKTELQVRQLPQSRSSYVVLFCDELVRKCNLCTNERIVINTWCLEPLHRADMYSFLALFFSWWCSGFSISETLELLHKMDCPVPLLSLVRFLSSNILAVSSTGSGDNGESVCCSQRDQTVRLSEFEMAAYSRSCKVFLPPSYTFATLDDDLHGTRASDNQSKLLEPGRQTKRDTA